MVGDGEFIARVLSMDRANALNKCGIMVRETLSSGSKYAFIGLTSGSGAVFQSRTETDGNSTVTNSDAGVAPPYWIKIARQDRYIRQQLRQKVAFGRPWEIPSMRDLEMGCLFTQALD